MQAVHTNKATAALNAMINEFYSAIKNAIDKNGGVIAFGNSEFFTSKGTVKVSVNGSEPENLSEETDVLRLASIADTLEDYLECKAAGNDKYSVLWNYDIFKNKAESSTTI